MESVKALNIIEIVFSDDKNVLNSWKDYYDKLCVQNPNSADIKNPSIPEFCALLNNTEPPTQSTYICYRKTCMNSDDFSMEEWRGMKLGFQPVIDAYIYMNNKGTCCNFVVTFCRGELGDADNILDTQKR